MQQNQFRNRCRPFTLSSGLVLVVVLFIAGPTRVLAQATAGGHVDPSDYLYKLGFTFQPASTCSNVNCHGAAAGGVKKNKVREAKTDSFTLWNADGTPDAPPDPHHSAFKELSTAAGKAIAQKMGIARAAGDAKCISCHALNPPEALLKPAKPGDPPFKVSDGVSCNACHGPSGTWTPLHDKQPDAAKSWAVSQQAALGGHEQLLKKFGFFNTRPLIERAQRCASCHLAIDPQMVAAGHPQPMFELNWFSLTYSNRHWNDPHDDKDPLAPYFGARLWAAGQVVSLHDALEQLAARAEVAGTADREVFGAYNQAMSHYTVFSPAFSTGAIKGSMTEVAAQVTAARVVLVGGPAKRPDLAKSAHAAAAAVEKLYDATRSYEPTQESTLKLVAVLVKQTTTADTLGGFGIEQQRDAIFALYNAYATSPGAPKAATDTRDAIGQKLFPQDAGGKLIKPEKVPPADFKKALGEVKAAVGA